MMDQRTCTMILKEYKINHAEVLFRGDYGADDLIDVVMGNRVYLRALYVASALPFLHTPAANPCSRLVMEL